MEYNLSKVKVVLHSQDNREHDILDSDDYYQFQGGLISAVKKTSGNNPQAYFADNSRYQRPRIHKLSKEIDKVVRSRLLNPKWLEGMKQHGYKGAFEMSASLDYLFSFDATTNLVPNWCYESIASNWLVDEMTRKFIITLILLVYPYFDSHQRYEVLSLFGIVLFHINNFLQYLLSLVY